MNISSKPRTNHLIAGLPEEALQQWLPRLERVQVPQGLALHESGRRMSHAYFPTTAVMSLLQDTADGASIELAAVGNEGVVGVELLLGGGFTTGRAVVRSAGEALRLPARTMQEEFIQDVSATRVLLRYTMALITQIAQMAVCNRHHSLDQRLCSWLLTSLDRVHGSEIVTTQEQIANMLGVRREGVTAGAIRLQALGLIHYARGRILVPDRSGLEEQACECYAVVKQEYDRLIPAAIEAPGSQPGTAAPGCQATVPDNARMRTVIAMASALRRAGDSPATHASKRHECNHAAMADGASAQAA